MKKFLLILFLSVTVHVVYGVDAAYQRFWVDRYMSVCLPLKSITVTSPYGERADPFTKQKKFHSGVDLQARFEPVYSMFRGVVLNVGSEDRGGRFVKILYGSLTVSYCHLSAIYVHKGDSLLAGDVVALSGQSGRATGPHLHITCIRDGRVTNPSLLIDYINNVRREAVEALGGTSATPKLLSFNPQYFLDYYAPLAMEEQRLFGIPASVTLAQMAFESDWGRSVLARKGNNFFGIKCSSQWLSEGKPYSQHDDDKPGEKFCHYGSVEESVRHHSQVLTSKRYQRYCHFPPTDYLRWLQGLKKAGYATAPDYVASCLRIIKKYKLFLYDTFEEQKKV